MIGQRQIMKQQQKLTPQQVMVLRLLHMPMHELMKAIKEEVEKNPLLEAESMQMESLSDFVDRDRGEVDDDDFDTRAYSAGSGEREEREWQVASEPTFAETLHSQLDMKQLSETEAVIGHELIGSLDDSGYLTRDLGIVANDIALYKGLDVEPKEVERVLKIVQSMDPAGIGARSLQECLSLQLHRIESPNASERLATEIVDRWFAAFTQHKYDLIEKKTGAEEGALREALTVIQRLNPKPGESSDSMGGKAAAVMADMTVYVQDGNVTFQINDKYIPKLRVDSSYLSMLDTIEAGGAKTKESEQTAEFIKNNAEEATSFIEALDLRHGTMVKVMKEIVKRQKRYFQSGSMGDLEPMLQKEVAEATGLDESTVSRMVNSKYVKTPYGMMQLKELFSNAIKTDEGEEVSSRAVKEALKEAVENEDKKKPLSDEELSALLKTKGFPTARRTVAKYREAMGIPTARLRRMMMGLLLICMTTLATSLNAQSAGDQKPAEPNKERAQLPAVLWYGNNVSDAKVRLKEMPLDSLPDEINIRLLRKGEQFVFPVKCQKSSPYGWRWERPHRGVDIALKTGEPIHCVFDGVVRIAKPMGGYGNLVVVRHYNGLETVYGHLSKINVKPRQELKAGDVLGLGGSTGHSTGPHLHFEVRFQYETFDPEWLLDFSNYSLRTQRLHLDKSYFGIKKPRGRKGESIAYKADKSFIKEQERRGPKEMYYVIKSGDSLVEIAHRYSTTVEKIRMLNDGLPKKPKPGTKIRVR